MRELMVSAALAASPLPSSPTRGEVPADASCTIEQQPRFFTSPLVGEAGRGVPHALSSEEFV